MTANGVHVRFRGEVESFRLDVEFYAPRTGVTGLIGPSGSGKTTVLRCIAGLQKFPVAACAVGDDVWQDEKMFLPTWRRPLGYVFQEPSLFPHLSVRDNLFYGAPAKSFGAVAFNEIMDLLGLAPLLSRAPQNLSGGERQRVAIGRALLSDPKLLLMDEPLAALDQAAKDDILPFLERMHERLSIPVIYVSHDMTEIERLADHLVLMDAGRVAASGKLADLQSDPDLPLARGREAAVSFDAEVGGYDAQFGLLSLRIGGAQLLAPSDEIARGALQRIRISARDVSLVLEPSKASTILNVLPATIIDHRPIGRGEMLVVLGLQPRDAGPRLLARITRRSWEALALAAGKSVWAQVKGVSLARRRSGHTSETPISPPK